MAKINDDDTQMMVGNLFNKPFEWRIFKFFEWWAI